MRIISLLATALLLVSTPALAKRLHPERSYQEQWCTEHGGQAEVRLPDGTQRNYWGEWAGEKVSKRLARLPLCPLHNRRKGPTRNRVSPCFY